MKMTMHIDEALLERVMKDYNFPSKTEAVEAALKEMDRQMRIREFRKNGLGLTREELLASVDPAYRVRGEPEPLMAAEDPAPPYGSPDPR
ncbi:MAG: type II toxin-antitoxin system VapB family antitoxin [Opitutaceae bacterium]|nr:type II toxin-antitoxin system VapB family antitoxin [Opitutaceae bacterium]